MWFGYMLLRRNRKVIYDVHEDLPRQIKWKQHIKAFLRPVISFCAEIAEKILSRKFSAIVAATPHIGDRFRRYNSLVEVVCNYVIQEEFSPVNSFTERPSNLCYIGGLTEPRGLRELINAMEDINPGIRLNLAGKFEHKEFENEIKQTKGWQRVIFFGYADRKKIREILDNSVIGLLTLHPSPGYLDSLPVKLFEYMASGIPVIASDFPLWKSIIIDNNCGLCLNPLKPKEISNAIMQLVNDRSMAESMGLNGLAAVQREFNWETQKNKLFQLYKNL
jgi:glycosyltransferase involved in cell wall biosynthesis